MRGIMELQVTRSMWHKSTEKWVGSDFCQGGWKSRKILKYMQVYATFPARKHELDPGLYIYKYLYIDYYYYRGF
jgi:hypothetical protein